MEANLAGRWPRLKAQIVDGLIIGVPGAIAGVIAALSVRTGGGVARPEFSPVLVLVMALFALYALVILVVQILKLHKQGQTIGKEFARVKIVKISDGTNGGVVTNVVMRGIVPGLIGAVPFIGPVFGIVDILFIFREDRRCIHDLIAGTRVVES
jgi:uncharacterized RDD family membrane protein YckC